MWPYGVLGVKGCFGNDICTDTFPKTTPISRWPLLLCQCTRMKEIVSRVCSRIREKRWLPSVPRITRTHTTVTVIAHFDINTLNKKKVAYIHESIFTSISTHFYNSWKWENSIIYIWTRVLRKECNKEFWRECFNNILSALTILGFVHVNLMIFLEILIIQRSVVLYFSPLFTLCLLGHCHICDSKDIIFPFDWD